MGANFSANVIDNAVNDYTNIVMQNLANCSIASTNTQNITLNLHGNTTIGGITQDQTAIVNQVCLEQLKNDAQVKNNVQNLAKQIAESTTKGLGALGLNLSVNTTSNVTDFFNNITETSLANCAESVANSQNILVNTDGNTTINFITQKQYSGQVAKCILESSNNAQLQQSVLNDIDQAAKSSAEGIDINTIFIVTGVIIGVIILAIVLAIIIKSVQNRKVQESAYKALDSCEKLPESSRAECVRNLTEKIQKQEGPSGMNAIAQTIKDNPAMAAALLV